MHWASCVAKACIYTMSTAKPTSTRCPRGGSICTATRTRRLHRRFTSRRKRSHTACLPTSRTNRRCNWPNVYWRSHPARCAMCSTRTTAPARPKSPSKWRCKPSPTALNRAAPSWHWPMATTAIPSARCPPADADCSPNRLTTNCSTSPSSPYRRASAQRRV